MIVEVSNKALQSDSGAIVGALRALLFDAAAAERGVRQTEIDQRELARRTADIKWRTRQ